MSSTGAPGPAVRTNNLAQAFQEAFTVILRMRLQTQRVEDAESFRSVMRQIISSAVKECRAMGYSDEASKMSIYAIIGFLDENVLSSGNPVFAEWRKRPLQEEMFGSQVAGELFFRNVSDLLNRPSSAETADVLELHALCLLLGYRGKFVTGDATEIHAIIRRVRDKIGIIRGEPELFRAMEEQPAPAVSRRDLWARRLVIAAIAACAVTLLIYLGYALLLSHSISSTAQSSLGAVPQSSLIAVETGQERAA